MAKKAEIEKLNFAIEKVSSHLDGMYEIAADEFGEKNAAVFEMQKMLLNDVSLYGLIYKKIEEGLSATEAIKVAADEYSSRFLSSEDEVFKAKANDIIDIAKRLINAIYGEPLNHVHIDVDENGTVNGDELSPSDILLLDRTTVKKIVFKTTSIYAHSVIIAKARGFEIDLSCNDSANENISAVNDLFSVFNELNVKSFMRTEFLFMNRNSEPSYDEQNNAYANYLSSGGDTIRIFDLGADKRVSYIETDSSVSEYSLRGIRFAFYAKEMLMKQVEAIVRCALDRECTILLPMVTSVEEVNTFREKILNPQIENVSKKMEMEIKSLTDRIKVGVMIETPAAAIISDELAKVSDVFMIGVNDLMQYTYAVDRQSVNLSKVYSSNKESLRRLVGITLDNAKKNSIDVYICGDSIIN